ncbi:hypothetical protein GQ457_14G022260 [Hibiscus cannabinus]
MAPPELVLDEVNDHSALEAQIFSNKRVNVCLIESNFLLWKQQVVLTIRGLGLEGYLDGSMPCPGKFARNRAGEQILNPSYVQYVKQDSSLGCCLQSLLIFFLS